jgi:hypothetical protein
MITITHTPQNLSYNRYTIECSDIDLLIEDCVKRIRSQSKLYYEKELRLDLQNKKESMIDVHAGMGVSYIIKLITKN